MIITDNANTAVNADAVKPAHISKPTRRMARQPKSEANIAAAVPAQAHRNPAPFLPSKPPRVTKSAAVIALLQRPQGATLAELIAATGWLPHTTRAALTGIRKQGQVIEKVKRGETTCYRIAPVPA